MCGTEWLPKDVSDEVYHWNEGTRKAFDELWNVYLKRVDWPEAVTFRPATERVEVAGWRGLEPQPQVDWEALMDEVESVDRDDMRRFYLNRWEPSEGREDRCGVRDSRR